jgi:RNase P subunit RPR2
MDGKVVIRCVQCRSFLCETDDSGRLLLAGVAVEQGVYVSCRGCGKQQRIAVTKTRNREILLTASPQQG